MNIFICTGEDSGSESDSAPEFRSTLEGRETQELYAMLKDVDNPTAEKIHPNDRRKLIR